MNKFFMKCGHTANSTCNDKPYCVICDCAEVSENTPSLAGRKARCWCCDKLVDSNFNLPFFEHRPDREYDSYYCGCGGWE